MGMRVNQPLWVKEKGISSEMFEHVGLKAGFTVSGAKTVV
jgi:hypothetical protein